MVFRIRQRGGAPKLYNHTLPTTTTTSSSDNSNSNDDDESLLLARSKSHAPLAVTAPLWWIWFHRLFATLVLFYVANVVVYRSLTPPVLPNLNHLHLVKNHYFHYHSSHDDEPRHFEKEMGEEGLSTFLATHQNCSQDNIHTSQSPLHKNDTKAQTAGAKTLWMPSYPDTMDEHLLQNLVSSVTGLTAPVKAYYLQSKDLRRCQSKSTTTAFCTIVHPMVELRPPPTNAKFTSYMDSSIVYVLRNPKTLFPAHFNAKAIKYHGAQGQVGLKEWRTFRNHYFPTLLTSWKTQIRAWLPPNSKEEYYYRVALWLPYEHFVHPDQGPALAASLVDILETAGYSTIRTNDDSSTIPCLWYKTAAETLHRLQHQGDYFDFAQDYVPGYTRAQRDLLMQEIQSLMDELEELEAATQSSVMAILKEYYEDVRDHTTLDEEGGNDETGSAADAEKR